MLFENLRHIGHSWLSLKLWIRVWLIYLNIVCLLSFLFISNDKIYTWILVCYAATGPYLLAIMLPEKGLSRILGVAHIIPWTALVIFISLRLISTSAIGEIIDYENKPYEFIYLNILLYTLIICLAFDYYDVFRWFKGEKYIIGSPEANTIGASGLSKVYES